MGEHIDGYNPSLKNSIPRAYRPWYVLIIIFSIVIGACLIALGIAIKAMDESASWLLCHIWTGLPLFVGGFVAIIPCGLKSRKWAIFYLMFMLACVVVCAAGAIINGFQYWMHEWRDTKIAMDRGVCTKVEGSMCTCPKVLVMPVKVSSCDTLKHVVLMMVSTIALDVGGFIVSTMAVFVSFMSVCCGPWVYVSDYNEKEVQDGAGAKTNNSYECS